MAFTFEDHLVIHEVVSLHGHLFDNGELDRLDELFTSDIVFDASEYVGDPAGHRQHPRHRRSYGTA
jgi:hypothetical protein